MTTIKQATQAAITLASFMAPSQLGYMGSMCRGEEGEFFKAKMVELAETVTTMPKTYEQDGKGDDAVAYLHYFMGGGDWYITEKDMETDQLQAFGLAMIHERELGYISIVELQTMGVMLDLHFDPKRIGDIK